MKNSMLIICLLAAVVAAGPLETLQQQQVGELRIHRLAMLQDMQTEAESVLPETPAEEKDLRKAFLMSLVLPGWGQYYAEARGRAAIYFGLEAGLWLTYGGFQAYGGWREQDYKTYAASHAGVDPDGKQKSFFLGVENYDSIDEYNAAQLRQRNTVDYYYDTETFYWNWESTAKRDRFGQLRKSADRAYNRATLTLGAILANHVVSAVDAILAARRFNADEQASIGFDMQFGDGLRQPYVNVRLSKNF